MGRSLGYHIREQSNELEIEREVPKANVIISSRPRVFFFPSNSVIAITTHTEEACGAIVHPMTLTTKYICTLKLVNHHHDGYPRNCCIATLIHL